MFKRSVWVIAMIFIMCVTVVMTGCSKNNQTSLESPSTTPAETTTPTNSSESPSQEEIFDFGGRKIVIFDYGNAEARAEALKTETGQRDAARVAEVEKKYNVKIEYSNDTQDAIYASIVAGSPSVDILSGGGPHLFPQQIGGNLIMPLDDLGVFDFNDPKWDQAASAAVMIDGKHYGVQKISEGIGKMMLNQVVYYNKSLLQREGLTDDLYALQASGQWTWDKLFEIASKITKDTDGDGKIDQWGIGDNQYGFLMNLIWSNNADFVGNVDGQVKWTLGSENGMQALNVYHDLAANKKIMRVLQPNQERDQDTKAFFAGKVGFIADYLNRIDTGFQDMKDDYGILIFPKGPQASDYISNLNWFGYWTIPTGVKNPEQIARVMNDLFNPLFTAEEEEAAFTTQAEAIVRDQGSIESIRLLPSKTVVSSWLGYPLNWGAIFDEATKIANGEKTPEAVMQEVTDKYNQIIVDTWKKK